MVNHLLDPLVISDDLKPKLLVVVMFVFLAAGEDDNADGGGSNPKRAERTDSG